MRSSLTLIAATLFVPLHQAANAQVPVAPSAEDAAKIHAENCMVGYIRKVDVPAEAQGKLTEVKIEEGILVKKDEILAVIDDTQAKLNLDLKKAEEEVAILNATNEVNLQDAKNSEKLAAAEAEAYKELHRQRATPFWEMEKKRLEAERAKLRIDLAEMNIKIAKAEYFGKRSETRIAEEEIKRRQIKAPFDGYIETRHAQLGAWVQPGTPIATLVMMDELRVEGDVDALRYAGQVTIGSDVQVLIYNTNRDPIAIDAKIGYVSTEIDLNNRYRVWVTVPNQRVGSDWLIKPGMRAEIIVHGKNAGQ